METPTHHSELHLTRPVATATPQRMSSAAPTRSAMDAERKLLYALAEALPAILPEVAQHVMVQAREEDPSLEAVPAKTRIELEPARRWEVGKKGAGPEGRSLELHVEMTVVVIAERQLSAQLAKDEVRKERSTTLTVTEGGVLFEDSLFVASRDLDSEAVQEVLLRVLGVYDPASDEYESEGDEGSDNDDAA
jgi:hypothetical protein